MVDLTDRRARATHAALARAQAENQQLVEALRISQLHFDESQRSARVGSWEFEIESGASWWSDETCRIFGIEPGTYGGTKEAFNAFVHPEDRETVARYGVSVVEGDPPPIDYRIVRPDGAIRILHEIGEIVRDAAGRPTRFVGTTQDITDAVAADEERSRLVAAVEQTADSIWMQDLNNMVTYVNPAFTRAYGYATDEIVGRHARLIDSGRHDAAFFTDIWSTAAAGRIWTGSIVNRRRDGTDFEVEAVISGIRDVAGRVIGFMQTDRDVTRERRLESALEREARERGSIEAALARIDAAATPEQIAAIACSEIVGLSNVDSAFVVILEPDAGWVLATEGLNAALIPSGSVIPPSRRDYLRERAGRGPWVDAWRPRPEDGPAGSLVTSTGLHSTAYSPFACLGETIGLIGIAAYDDAGASRLVERLPALVTFGSIVGTLIGARLGERRHAAAERATVQTIIDTTAFRPFFQQIVDLRDGTVVGHEALTRFADGRAPNVVFAAAGRAGLGIELEVASLRASIATAASLPAGTFLSLNASPELFLSGRIGALVAPATRPIVLEITEHVAIDDYDALRSEVAKLGRTIRLSVDDAGAGYASFRHILELAPDYVKVDIGLVRNVDTEPARQALIAGMGYFAVKRGLHLIAEGIETAAELEALRALAVPFGQGFLLGVPRDAGDPEPWAERIDLPAVLR
ncbi:MAG TPA: EAL domain-containing protein [Candidatus Acidoferrum sp.]|nr:EAL domain-containing protein [Candidatus Acidoferrum sp.]